MSDLTLAILNDREKYPDDREIQLADGEKITVKELRDTLQPRSEFTRASEGWARKERELQGSVEGLQAQLAEAIKQRAPAPDAARPAPAGGYSEEELLADPVLGTIMKKLNAATAAAEAHEARLAAHEKYVKTREYNGTLSTLGEQHNRRFNPDGKGKAWDQKEFLDYAMKKPVFIYNPDGTQDIDLETTYQKWVRNDEIALIQREAEARGIEKGREASRVPNVPFGRRRPPQRAKDMPEDFQSVTEEQIANDPEIQEAMAKDAGE